MIKKEKTSLSRGLSSSGLIFARQGDGRKFRIGAKGWGRGWNRRGFIDDRFEGSATIEDCDKTRGIITGVSRLQGIEVGLEIQGEIDLVQTFGGIGKRARNARGRAI